MNTKSRFQLIILLSLLFTSAAFAVSNTQKLSEITPLNVEWELYLEKSPAQTFSLVDNKKAPDFNVIVPNEWNAQVLLSGKTSPETYGCYRYVCKNLDPGRKYAIHIKESPGTACTIYANRRIIGNAGDPFAMLDENYSQKSNHYGPSHSKCIPLYCEFYPDKNGEAELVVFVANYYYRKGGLWDPVYLGPAEAIWHFNVLTMIFYCIVIGSLLFTCLLNLLQFFLNKKRTEYFYLGIASLAFAIRIATAGYCSLSVFFPSLTAELKLKLEMIPMWLVPVAILQLLFLIYPLNNKSLVWQFIQEKIIRYSLIVITLVIGILTLVLPAWYTNRLVPLLQILMIVYALYVLIYGVLNLIKKKRYSFYNFLSFFTIAAGGIIDIIHQSSKSSIPIPTLPFFILVFVIVQIIMLAAIQNDINRDTIKGSDDLRELNDAYLRFVPKDFLSLLNHDSITKTKLGDYSNIEMSIMFSKLDISFTKEDYSLDKHFSIFNDYLKIASPVIKKHNGFLSKFLNGGFIALFPDSEEDAVNAALEINDIIKTYNDSNSHEHKINPRTGLHCGKMIIGTIGDENRLDDTVISDTVNTVARIQENCCALNKNIIISEAVENRLSADFMASFEITPLDVIYMKGKEKPLKLFEVCRNNSDKSKKEEK